LDNEPLLNSKGKKISRPQSQFSAKSDYCSKDHGTETLVLHHFQSKEGKLFFFSSKKSNWVKINQNNKVSWKKTKSAYAEKMKHVRRLRRWKKILTPH
jgi:hypothetical protein